MEKIKNVQSNVKIQNTELLKNKNVNTDTLTKLKNVDTEEVDLDISIHPSDKMQPIYNTVTDTILKNARSKTEILQIFSQSIFQSQISESISGVQEGNFLAPEKIRSLLEKEIELKEAKEGIYQIVGTDGTILGYTSETGKNAYNQLKSLKAENYKGHAYLQNEDLKRRGFELTTDNPTYELSEADFKEVAATMYAEAARGSYDDNLAVASTIAYRAEHPKLISQNASTTLQGVVSEKNQFEGYQSKNYKAFIEAYENNTLTDEMKVSIDVLNDMISGLRNHTCYGYFTSYSGNKIVAEGNGYKRTWKEN